MTDELTCIRNNVGPIDVGEWHLPMGVGLTRRNGASPIMLPAAISFRPGRDWRSRFVDREGAASVNEFRDCAAGSAVLMRVGPHALAPAVAQILVILFLAELVPILRHRVTVATILGAWKGSSLLRTLVSLAIGVPSTALAELTSASSGGGAGLGHVGLAEFSFRSPSRDGGRPFSAGVQLLPLLGGSLLAGSFLPHLAVAANVDAVVLKADVAALVQVKTSRRAAAAAGPPAARGIVSAAAFFVTVA